MALIEAIDKERPAHPETQYDIGYNNGLTMAQAICLRMDAVPVVRCKDCKHWAYTANGAGDCRNPRFTIPDTVDPTMLAHEFCALGERSTE